MKFQILLGALGLSIGVAACEASDQPATSSVENEELGACGANADPSTGVICKLSYEWTRRNNPTFASSETFDKDGIDFVRCKWSVECGADANPRSVTFPGKACVAVIGTGCRSDAQIGTHVREIKLPPGTMANQLDDFCKNNSAPVFNDADNACALLNHDNDQGEDQCCLPRADPPPRDAGVSLDARPIGVADAGVSLDARPIGVADAIALPAAP